MDFWFYQVLRVIVCAGAIWLTFRSLEIKLAAASVSIPVMIALIYNPLIELSLKKEAWFFVNAASIVALGYFSSMFIGQVKFTGNEGSLNKTYLSDKASLFRGYFSKESMNRKNFVIATTCLVVLFFGWIGASANDSYNSKSNEVYDIVFLFSFAFYWFLVIQRLRHLDMKPAWSFLLALPYINFILMIVLSVKKK